MKILRCRMRLARHFMLVAGLTAAGFCHNAQAQDAIAIIPLFHDRSHQAEGDNVLQLSHQRVIVFVYRNAAAVYMDATFLNTESDSITHELALPSEGHTSIRSNARSNGILGVQLWVGSDRVEPSISQGRETWYTIAPSFGSHEEKKIHALFWVQTSLSKLDESAGQDTTPIHEGRRGFLIDMQHAAAWKNVIQSLDISVNLRESLTRKNSRMGVEPKNYDDQRSGFSWSLQNVEPSFADDVAVLYTPPAAMASHWNTMAKVSDFIEKSAYDELLKFVHSLDEE